MVVTLEVSPAETGMEISPEAAEKLQQVFGFDQLRPGQAEVIACLLAGRSSLAVFPTGGGFAASRLKPDSQRNDAEYILHILQCHRP